MYFLIIKEKESQLCAGKGAKAKQSIRGALYA
jgi:hypothetical protein